MKRLFLLTVVMFFCQIIFAQLTFQNEYRINNNQESLQQLNINKDYRLDRLVNWHIQNNKRRDGIDGHRVEIFSTTNDKQGALDKKVEFMSKYPDIDVYILFISPIFRVRVGDFRTKSEAYKLLKRIERDYNAAFVVKDNINFPSTRIFGSDGIN